MDINGNVGGGWTTPVLIPGWFGNENQGGGITVARLNGTSNDLIVFHIDNPGGENHGYYRVGRNIDRLGVVRDGWVDPILIPGWFGSENSGGGVSAMDVNGNSGRTWWSSTLTIRPAQTRATIDWSTTSCRERVSPGKVVHRLSIYNGRGSSLRPSWCAFRAAAAPKERSSVSTTAPPGIRILSLSPSTSLWK